LLADANLAARTHRLGSIVLRALFDESLIQSGREDSNKRRGKYVIQEFVPFFEQMSNILSIEARRWRLVHLIAG
jgi:hypothetical protein